MGGISIWQLVIVLAIVLVVFGTKRLRGMGGDVGTAIKGFKDSMKDGETEGAQAADASSDKAAASSLGTDGDAGQPARDTVDTKQKANTDA